MKNKKLIISITILIFILVTYLFYSNFSNSEKYLIQEKPPENNLKISRKSRDKTENMNTSTASELDTDKNFLDSEDLKEKDKSSRANIKNTNNKTEEKAVLRKAIYTFHNEKDPFFKDSDTEITKKENYNKNYAEEKIKEDKNNTEQNRSTEETNKIENENKNTRKKIIEIPFVLKGIIGDKDKRYAVISYKDRTEVKKANEKIDYFLITKIKDSSIEIEYQDYKHEIFIWRHQK